MQSFGLWGIRDLKTYHFQSIFVGKEAMEVWVGGIQTVETGCYCKIWRGMGWMVIKTS